MCLARICYRPSVRLSVHDTGGSVKNGEGPVHIVAENGNCRRFRRQIVAEIGDYT